MIPNDTLQKVDTLGLTAPVSNFRITDATQARILMSLSDKMYTRKQLAVLREYSTNAADAHVMVDKPISDIQVSLPTLEDLNFRIRDFGTGLTEDEIKNVYCVFGESTKRNSNKLNGVLGYGCKAGFADCDSFTVTSWCNGEKTVYQCIKGDSSKLHSSVCLLRIPSDEPTGIEICVPVKQNAVYSYHREATHFYRHWPVMPTIKGLSEECAESIAKYRSTPATLKGNGWEVRPQVDGARGTAYMGYVPYLIDWNVLYHRMSLDAKTRALFELIKSNDVTLYFEMGEVNFVDSREQLEYTDMTFNALVARITEIFGKIQSAIQEKFTDLATIWDAKIMYNAIFGTGVLEVEKGESESGITDKIKILDGNLLQLERTFQDAFTWNGIVIRGPWFDNINRFDNDSFGTSIRLEDSDHNPNSPVMVTYRKKKSRVKSNRCTADKCNKIVASSKVAVVINDTGRKTGQQMSAKYLIFDRDYTAVHVLTFETAELKELFYKTYDFDTVPVIKLSEIMTDAKKWNNVNKVSRNYGGGGGGARPMQYLDLDSGEVQESEVPVREIEEGAFYLKLAPQIGSRRRRNREACFHGSDGYSSYNAKENLESFRILCEELDLDVDRIYIINEKTSESKWFREATASGEWTLVWTAIKDAMPSLTMDIDTMIAEAYENTQMVCDEAAKMLTPLILQKNSPILALISTVSNRNYDTYVKVKDAFKALGLWSDLIGDRKGTIDFNKSKENAHACYPYLPWANLEYENYVSEESIKSIANYINSADLFAKLTRHNLLSAVVDVDCSVPLSDSCLSTTEVVG
jgi:hypothetical protein